jgi:hypothetical protein
MADQHSPSPLAEILAEMLQGFRRPAALIDEHSTVIYMNARVAQRRTTDARDLAPSALPGWRCLASFMADDRTLYLGMPNQSSNEVPPRRG